MHIIALIAPGARQEREKKGKSQKAAVYLGEPTLVHMHVQNHCSKKLNSFPFSAWASLKSYIPDIIDCFIQVNNRVLRVYMEFGYKSTSMIQVRVLNVIKKSIETGEPHRPT